MIERQILLLCIALGSLFTSMMMGCQTMTKATPRVPYAPCPAFSGSAEATATLDFSAAMLQLKLIDDKPWAGQMECTSRVVTLLPGAHRVVFNYELTGLFDTGLDTASISFNAEAGQRYRLQVKRMKAERYHCSIITADTEVVVAERDCERDSAKVALWTDAKDRFAKCGVGSLWNTAGTWYGFEPGEDYRTSIFLQWLHRELDAGVWLSAARENGYPVPQGAAEFYSARELSSFVAQGCRLAQAH